MKGYIHKVNYYETDKMGIVHHSNYIRFMEEARLQYLDDVGFSMQRIEALGFASPVAAVECRYKSPCAYGDEIEIEVKVKKYTGVKLGLYYEMRNIKNGRLVAAADSEHCFVAADGSPVAVKKHMPELDAIFTQLLNKQ